MPRQERRPDHDVDEMRRMVIEEGRTLRQAGERFGIGRERVRQLIRDRHGSVRELRQKELGR